MTTAATLVWAEQLYQLTPPAGGPLLIGGRNNAAKPGIPEAVIFANQFA